MNGLIFLIKKKIYMKVTDLKTKQLNKNAMERKNYMNLK